MVRFVIALLAIFATSPVAAETPMTAREMLEGIAARFAHFDRTVTVCVGEVRIVYPQFSAFIVNDGNHNKTKQFGTQRGLFLFELCMNEAGYPEK